MLEYQRHLYGWLSYAFASEVFVIVSLTLFLPICLEQFARDNGFLLPDKTIPCTSASEGPRCVVKIGWLWVDTASFSLYVYSASVALQALTVISMGGIADHPPHRKKLLLTFAFLGAISAFLFLPLSSFSVVWILCAPLAVLANIGFGASVVAMNAYLPSLAKEAPDVVVLSQRKPSPDADDTLALPEFPNSDTSISSEAGLNDERRYSGDAQTPLLSTSTESGPVDKKSYDEALSAATSRISGLGIAIGYSAGIALLLLTLIPVTKLESSTFSLRLAIGLSGIWWALFSIPSALWLPGTPAKVEEFEEEDGVPKPQFKLGRAIVGAWKRLGGMLTPSEIKKLRNTFKYLAAWFLLSDGFTTITSTALLFAKTTLSMPAESLILIGVLTPVSGIIGSLIWPRIQRWVGLSNLRILVTLVIMASLIPTYGCLGFLPVFQSKDEYGTTKASFGGLTTPGEMYVLSVYFGLVYGAFQGYARAFYAELLPEGEEARWYGLFSITDKSSSFLGPLAVGLIADATGNIRFSFFFLVGMIWLALPILASIDVEKGRKDAKMYRYGREVGV